VREKQKPLRKRKKISVLFLRVSVFDLGERRFGVGRLAVGSCSGAAEGVCGAGAALRGIILSLW
jgi:hypothetical protein